MSTALGSQKRHESRAEQASQMLAMLEAQFAELDRREQTAIRTLSELDGQQQHLKRLTVELDRREQSLVAREKKVADLESRSRELLQRSEQLKRLAEDLEQQRVSLREELASELECERQALQARFEQETASTRSELTVAQHELEKEREAIASELARLQVQQAEHQQQLLSWEQEKTDFWVSVETQTAKKLAELQTSFDAEVSDRRKAIEDAQRELSVARAEHEQKVNDWTSAFEQKQLTFEQELAARREELESAIRNESTLAHTLIQQERNELVEQQRALEQKIADWAAQRDAREKALEAQLQTRLETFEVELQSQLEAFETDLQRREMAFDIEFQRKREHLMREVREARQKADAELNTQRERLATESIALAASRDELLKLREDHAQQSRTLRSQLAAELDQEKQRRVAALDLREAQLRQREIDLEKRSKLHAAHLERVQEQLRAKSTEIERQRQQQQIWKTEVENTVRLRLEQMRRYRELIEEREESLDVEHSAFTVQRNNHDHEVVRRQSEFAEQQQAWAVQSADLSSRLQQVHENSQHGYSELCHLHRSMLGLDLDLKSLISQVLKDPHAVDQNRLLEHVGEISKKLNELSGQLQTLESANSSSADLNTIITSLSELKRQQGPTEDSSLIHQQAQLAESRREWEADRKRAEQVILELVVQLETALKVIEHADGSRPSSTVQEERDAA